MPELISVINLYLSGIEDSGEKFKTGRIFNISTIINYHMGFYPIKLNLLLH